MVNYMFYREKDQDNATALDNANPDVEYSLIDDKIREDDLLRIN